MDAANIESNDPNGQDARQDALIRISFVNAALILDTAANDPALEAEYRNATQALADNFQRAATLVTKGLSSPEEYKASIDDLNDKEQTLKKLCGES